MSKRPNNSKSVQGRPSVMPAAKPAPNPRAPKSVPNVRNNAAGGGTVTDAASTGSQSDGTGGVGNQ